MPPWALLPAVSRHLTAGLPLGCPGGVGHRHNPGSCPHRPPPPRQSAKRLQEPRPSHVVSWRTAAGLPWVLALVRAELAFNRTWEEKERPFAAGYQARPRRAAVLPVGWGGLRPQGQIRPGAWGGSRGRGSARGVRPAPPPTPPSAQTPGQQPWALRDGSVQMVTL